MKPSDQIPKLIIDPKAETVAEMMAKTPYSRAWISHHCRDMVTAGKWERVWKRVGVKLIPAYRVKK